MTSLSEDIRVWGETIRATGTKLLRVYRDSAYDHAAAVAKTYSKAAGDVASDIAVAIERLKNED